MDRIPFGVSRLDDLIGGGAPTGSVVLLAGEAGAGAREFCYTAAAINGLGLTESDLFDLYYGDLASAATHPEAIHYVSFTAEAADLRNEMLYTMDEDVVEAGLEAVEFADLSQEFFRLSPVPRDWYVGETRDIDSLGQTAERRTVISALADYLDDHAPGNLLVLDSLTDLTAVSGTEAVAWQDVLYLLKGVRRAARSWNGTILLHVNRETLTDRRLGDLMASVDGTMLFEWASGGNERVRTMVFREFRGVLSQLEADDIVRFETEIHDAGFDVSDVRKIR